MTDEEQRHLATLTDLDERERFLERICTKAYERQRASFRASSCSCGKAPDPYAGPLAALSAAAATSESSFEERFKAGRYRALAAEHAALDAHLEATPPAQLSAADLEPYRPPDAHAAAIKALQSKEMAAISEAKGKALASPRCAVI